MNRGRRTGGKGKENLAIDRIKVLRVISRLNVGGPARHVALLAKELKERGYDTILVYGVPEDAEGSFEDLLIDEPSAIKLTRFGRRLKPWGDAVVFARLLRIMFSERPDIVHTHTAKAGVLGRTAAAIYNATRPRSDRAAVIHTFHGHVLEGYFGPRTNQGIRFVERTLAHVTDGIVAIAPHQRDELADRFALAPVSKFTVVRLGLELDPYLNATADSADIRQQLGISSSAMVFGCVGRLAPIKNIGLLVRAFAAVNCIMADSRLVIAGDGSERPALEKLASDLGVASAVIFLGWRRDLANLYKAFNVSVLSSNNEGTPVAVIEAMASELPIVATRVGGVPDVVVPGETGLLVPPGDCDALTAAMLDLARDPEKRARFGRHGRAAVRTAYGPARLASEIDTLYRTTLERKRSRTAKVPARASP